MQAAKTKESVLRSKLKNISAFTVGFAPDRKNILLTLFSSLLLIFSFPNFNLWFLAWVAFIPLLISISDTKQKSRQAFAIGWIFGTLFFYGTCYWLTYSMIRYGGIPTIIAYLLLIPAASVVGLFSAFFSLVINKLIKRFELKALLLAPFCWVAFEWLRFQITGQLWNATGYSQAFFPELIQTAKWGGAYAVGFLIVLVNTSIAYVWIERKLKTFVLAVLVIGFSFILIFLTARHERVEHLSRAVVVAIQPNVPMGSLTVEDMQGLFKRHIDLSEGEINKNINGKTELPRLVIWPESPMIFLYSRDTQLREAIAEFTKRNKTSLIINSLEPDSNDGGYNSALFIDENGNVKGQYDKIHLMPFGEYVPIPKWIPGASYIPAMVGDFTAGKEHDLFPVGDLKAGVFICFEAAFPNHTREFTKTGAGVLIEVTNDGYLGPTPVLRQHLSNAVFRAVETGRPIVRATNTGISAFITERGEVKDETKGFEATSRTWNIYQTSGQTFYVRYGDVFAYACLMIGAVFMLFCALKPKENKEELL